MNIEENIKVFEEQMSKVKRDGIEDLMDYIRNKEKSDMYSAPASARFHLQVKGGLLQHSLNVLETLKSLLHNNKDGTYTYYVCGQKLEDPKYTVKEENIIIIALLHDICKTNFYKTEQRWRKDENNKWESYNTFGYDDTHPLGHGEKSCLMIQQFMKLEPVELYSIRWHMGFINESQENIKTLSSAVKKYPLILATQTADMMASSFMEGDYDNEPMFIKKGEQAEC